MIFNIFWWLIGYFYILCVMSHQGFFFFFFASFGFFLFYLKYNSHAVPSVHLKCKIQWFVVQSCATITFDFKIFSHSPLPEILFLPVFPLVACAFDVMKSLPKPRSQNFIPMISSKRFIRLALSFNLWPFWVDFYICWEVWGPFHTCAYGYPAVSAPWLFFPHQHPC